ncbi:DNA ligase D [Peribacillus saganii]|uniref:DNA ligase D n=1 Tax=Peribacillus saganii TaxID=2303992 RepID=A0A372LJ46_9BACI|nr:DNA ligase D [Peribacillus saganii]RFU66415.1 DNA ligase D [Peribacillus saganii]
MKPMLPTLAPDPPIGGQWTYEVKYDGFRAILTIDQNIGVSLISRNGKQLIDIFPEISSFVKKNTEILADFVPLRLDCELVWLANPFSSDFSEIQWRGRLRAKQKIQEATSMSPCRLITFDLLEINGKPLTAMTYTDRKKLLADFFQDVDWPAFPDPLKEDLIQLVPATKNFSALMDKVILYDGEGIVAKQDNGLWEEGKRTASWLKIKNWKTAACFITAMHKENGYFSLGIFKDGDIMEIGQVKNGLPPHERSSLAAIVRGNSYAENSMYHYIHPSICIAVNFLHVYDEQELREPQFKEFLMDMRPEECTWELFCSSQYTFPESVNITSRDKPIWKIGSEIFTKIDYLHYLRQVSPWFLHNLEDKPATLIRYPHGAGSERFYQKNVPEYAPDFIKTFKEHDIEYILVNDIQTLLWLGNQLAIEFHVPFQKAGRVTPDDIVLDLDPPTQEQFGLAVKAALEIRKITDSLSLHSFIKTSGNRGLQIYIPLPFHSFSYSDTRKFTDFLADFLTNKFPDDFTIERLKRNRGNRLYLDFVQHSEGKTIIAPYSPRGNDFAGVAAPLHWDEVNEGLKLADYNVYTVPKRLRTVGCPFAMMETARNEQPFTDIINFLNKQ